MTSLSIVGHSDDLDEVTRTWSGLDRTRPATVVITGAPGVGKSRIAAAAVDALDPAPAAVLTGAARLHSPAPYDWLAAALDGVGRLSADLLGNAYPAVPPDALAWLAQEPDMPRERYAPDALLRIAVRVVRHLVGSGPSVLVAEDLHALDAASLNLLAALAATPDLPALLIVTSRPPATDAPTSDLVASTLARMCGSPGSVRVHLRPWGRDEVADALTQAYPGRAITDHIVDAALRRTGGIAYRLYELLADVGGRDPAMLAEPEPEHDEPAGRPAHGPLTAREQDVLACVASGMANKQIARSLGISVRTVAVHVSNVLRKTGTACRTDAALWAVRQETTDGASQSADQPEGADAAPALAR